MSSTTHLLPVSRHGCQSTASSFPTLMTTRSSTAPSTNSLSGTLRGILQPYPGVHRPTSMQSVLEKYTALLSKDRAQITASSSVENLIAARANPPIQDYNHKRYLQQRLSGRSVKLQKSRSMSTLSSPPRSNSRLRSQSSSTAHSSTSSSSYYGSTTSRPPSSPLWEVSSAEEQEDQIPRLPPLPAFGKLDFRSEEHGRAKEYAISPNRKHRTSPSKGNVIGLGFRISTSDLQKSTNGKQTVCGQQEPARSDHSSNGSASSSSASDAPGRRSPLTPPRIPPKSARRAGSSIATVSSAGSLPPPSMTYRNCPPAAHVVAKTSRSTMQSHKGSLVRIVSSTPTELERVRQLREDLRILDFDHRDL